MLQSVCPKLPMRTLEITKDFYINKLKFSHSSPNYPDYLILNKDQIEIHFFEFKELNCLENYGQIYIRCQDIKSLYAELIENQVEIHPNGQLSLKPWGKMEFSILDPDTNLITFGE